MYEWLPTESAPQRFPAYLIKGTLTLADGSSAAVPDRRSVFNGWGQRGSIHIVGALAKPVPVRLEIRWFSYTEDRFYEGSFDLPAAVIKGLFDTGLAEGRRTPQPVPYDRIIVGVAPGGLVAVWMAASAETVEVATFMARAVELRHRQGYAVVAAPHRLQW